MSTLDLVLPGLYREHRAYTGTLSELSRVRADLARDLAGSDPDLLGTVQLVTSELFANAAKYAWPGGRTNRIMSLTEGRVLRVAVTDPGGPTRPCIPTGRTEQEWEWAEGQRGLLLVENLAARWGLEAFPEGSGHATRVWADFEITPDQLPPRGPVGPFLR